MSWSESSIEDKFSREVTKAFSAKRIVSLLYFGTRAFDLNTHQSSDYDFMLILDKYAPTDLAKLRKITQKKPFANLDINLNFLYLVDFKARGKSNFQIRSLSLPFYEYLESANLLVGKNIFRKDPIQLSRDTITKMEDFKIQEYYGRCDKLYFQRISDRKLYFQLAKYTKDLIWLLLIRQNVIKTKDLTKISYEKILRLAKANRIITRELRVELQKLLKSRYNIANLYKLEKIRRSLYAKYLQFFRKAD